MDEFEKLLEVERVSVERFVRFRLNSKADADDVLQEVFLAACQKLIRIICERLHKVNFTLIYKALKKFVI